MVWSIPCSINGHYVMLRTDMVKSDIPCLLSNESMKANKTYIDVQNNYIRVPVLLVNDNIDIVINANQDDILIDDSDNDYADGYVESTDKAMFTVNLSSEQNDLAILDSGSTKSVRNNSTCFDKIIFALILVTNNLYNYFTINVYLFL